MSPPLRNALPLFEQMADVQFPHMVTVATDRRKMREPIGRIDADPHLQAAILPFCRLAHGEIWIDPEHGHIVAAIDSTDKKAVDSIVGSVNPVLCIADPPYNVIVGNNNTDTLGEIDPPKYESFTRSWLTSILPTLNQDSTFYVWLGADPRNGFHPFPEFCTEMRKHGEWVARNWITVRNQRGYGTQKNWMWVRQELLYYARGKPLFDVSAEYTDIPKILRGYYKDVGGKLTENTARGHSETIRAGNVWVDVQQVFYRLKENVPGCYAQKPLKSIQRIVTSASAVGDDVLDPFCHSGTTLIAAELLGRRSINFEVNPIFAEISIRRLERLRSTGETGWQCLHPFPEIC